MVKDFTNGFSTYLNSYTEEVQTLFDDLYKYAEKKLNSSENLNELINQYLEILDNMTEIAENEIEFRGTNVEIFMKSVFDKTIDVESDFFENYYLINISSYLEYPDEILYKISNLENALYSSSELVKKQINYIVNKKIWRIREENYYFISKTKDAFSKFIELKMDKVTIFDYYKEYRLKNNLGKITGKYIYSNNNMTDFLKENVYENNIKKIINEYKIIVSKIEERINNDWIINNCTNVDITNETDIICAEYKNKSLLNYSEYNFNVVKIRTGIYYIKYLYENLET